MNRKNTPLIFGRLIATLILSFCLLHPTIGQAQNYDNPIAPQRADPWVYRTDDGTYYFIATAPKYDRIILRKSESINGLKTAEEKVVWEKNKKGDMVHNIWAPELHRWDDTWYIYVAAAPDTNEWQIRMWVLSNPAKDPMQGKWKIEGQIKTDTSSFSLDATLFEHQGKHYLIWAQNVYQKQHGTALVLSEMKDPLTLTGPEVVITEPEFSWERVKHNVNEGPAVLQKNGRIFVSYSASATDHNYCIGLLWIDEKADLLQAANWQKAPAPIFHSNAEAQRFGPGHSCFTLAEDGQTDVLIYHARDFKKIDGYELADPNRATRARTIRWTPSGFPDFRQADAD